MSVESSVAKAQAVEWAQAVAKAQAVEWAHPAG